MSLFQYIKDTRGELHHVAWPTRSQTIIYTIIVIALSIFVALYLGFFDYIFTTIMTRSLEFLPQSAFESAAPLAPSQEIQISTSTPQE